LPSGEVNASLRRTASSSVTWPPTTFDQCGVLASSRSASHTLAPEFNALIAIFGSVGPVISTRRSRKVRRSRRHPPLVRTDLCRLGQEVEPAALARLLASPPTSGEQLVAAVVEPAVEVLHEGERLRRQHLVATLHRLADDLDVHSNHAPVSAQRRRSASSPSSVGRPHSRSRAIPPSG
jgi:hypothetical protein